MVTAARLLDLSDDEVELTTHLEAAADGSVHDSPRADLASSGDRPRPLIEKRQAYAPNLPGPTWAMLRDVSLLIEPGFDGVVYLADGRVVWETNRFVQPRAAGPDFGRGAAEARKGSSGLQEAGSLPPLEQLAVAGHLPSATVAFDPGWVNYYHWLLQVLPLAVHATVARRATDLVLPDHAAYQDRVVRPAFTLAVRQDSLTACLPDPGSIRVLGPGLYRVDRLTLPIPVNRREHNAVFDWSLGSRFVAQVRATVEAPGRAGRRLFVRRSVGSNRSLESWEADALEWLAGEAGFEPIELQTMSFGEQVAAFAGAEAVLGAHGSGLANIVFGDRLTVYEYLNPFMDEPVARTHFQLLAGQCGHEAWTIDRWALRHRREELVRALRSPDTPRSASSGVGAIDSPASG